MGPMKVIALILLVCPVLVCCTQRSEPTIADAGCPEVTTPAPTCDEICAHTTTLAAGCGLSDPKICVDTCHQVFDQPSKAVYDALRVCYLQAKSCDEIKACNHGCYQPPPIPEVSDGSDTAD